MKLSSSYIGAGNQASVFNRKGNIPFKHLKSIYGEELSLLKNERPDTHLKNHELSDNERLLLKEKIRELIKEQRRGFIISLLLTVIIISFMIFGIYYFLN